MLNTILNFIKNILILNKKYKFKIIFMCFIIIISFIYVIYKLHKDDLSVELSDNIIGSLGDFKFFSIILKNLTSIR